MDELSRMRVFVTVAQMGSFVEASRRLRLSPSVASRAIADLEAELGVRLLNRTTRSVRVTERGTIYAQSCRQILDDVAGAERGVRGESADPRGTLHVAAPIVFGRLHVLPIVQTILKAHAQLAVRLTLSDRNAHVTEEGIDVAVRIGELSDSGLIALRLGEVSREMVASPDYLARRGIPTASGDLTSHDTIAFEAIDAINEWRFGGSQVRVEPRLVVNSAQAAIAAAEDGLGITRALSYQVREAVEAGRLVRVLPDRGRERLPVNAVYRPRRIPSSNLDAFLEGARSYFVTNPIAAPETWKEAPTAPPGRGRRRSRPKSRA
jgi:DNA-binding transcriptional LysR family regulator